MTTFDVAVIGGGIIGTSAAAYLAEAGKSVVLLERTQVASGASGRNSGAIQHPFDREFAELHWKSLDLYRELPEATDGEISVPPEPAGLMLISLDEEFAAASAAAVMADWPELRPVFLPAGSVVQLEPALHPRIAACRLETGYPVAPAAATLAFARRATAAGAEIRTDAAAAPAIEGGRTTGVTLAGGDRIGADQILVAAGPWTPTLIPSWAASPPIRPIWGVVASTALPGAPRHVLEEAGIDQLGGPPDRMFSLVTAHGSTSVGSTFLPDEPDPHALAAQVLQRGSRFVPSLAESAISAVRACARPAAFDGRPIIGAIPGVDGLYVCAGHGPWGISTGPGSARLIADVMLGQGQEVAVFSPRRIPAAG
jgi:sarcosine oxidase subunit beta